MGANRKGRRPVVKKVDVKAKKVGFKQRLNRFNNKTALLIASVVGNMLFFWIMLLVILPVRLLGSDRANELLTGVDNDIQVLLIAVNCILNALQLKYLTGILTRICKKEDELCAELHARTGGSYGGNKA